MADIALVAAKVARIHPDRDEVYDFIAGATITAGQVVAITIATGKLDVGDADAAANLDQPRGIALNGGGAGQVIAVLKRGYCAGFTVAAIAYDHLVYESVTAGAIADAAAAVAVPCGRIVAMPDASLTKVIYFDFKWAIANFA